MAAFLRIVNPKITLGDDSSMYGAAAILLSKNISTFKYNLNISNIGSMLLDPYVITRSLTFEEVFMGNGNWLDYKFIGVPGEKFRTKEEILKDFNDGLISLLKEYKVEYEIYEEFYKLLDKFENPNELKTLHYNFSINILHFRFYYIDIPYQKFIGSTETEILTLQYSTLEEAVTAQKNIMNEISEFYKNYCNYIKEIK